MKQQYTFYNNSYLKDMEKSTKNNCENKQPNVDSSCVSQKSSGGRTSRKTQESLNLFNTQFSGGLSSVLSANTLRFSPTHYSFPKQERFLPIRSPGNSDFASLPSMLDNRKVSIGKGKKVEFLASLPAYEVPGPSDYKFNTSSFRVEKGVSFTTDSQPADTLYLPKSPYVSLCNASQVPGPSHYQVKDPRSFQRTKIAYTILGKAPTSYLRINEVPASNTYLPNFSSVQPSRYQSIGFGTGSRSEIFGSGKLSLSPGPGSYPCFSSFDRFQRVSKLGKIRKLQPIRIQHPTSLPNSNSSANIKNNSESPPI